jgi:hypothetical protein
VALQPERIIFDADFRGFSRIKADKEPAFPKTRSRALFSS